MQSGSDDARNPKRIETPEERERRLKRLFPVDTHHRAITVLLGFVALGAGYAGMEVVLRKGGEVVGGSILVPLCVTVLCFVLARCCRKKSWAALFVLAGLGFGFVALRAVLREKGDARDGVTLIWFCVMLLCFIIAQSRRKKPWE